MMRHTTKPTHHPLYRHPILSGVSVTPVEYHYLMASMMHSDAMFIQMNELVGLRRDQAVRTVYYPN